MNRNGLRTVCFALLFVTRSAIATDCPPVISSSTITNPTPAQNDRFGSSVTSVGSGRFAILSQLDDTVGLNAGAAYLFDQNGLLLYSLTNPDPGNSDFSGAGLASVGSSVLVVSAANDDQPDGINRGACHLFSTDTGNLLMTITNPASGTLHFANRAAGLSDGNLAITHEADQRAYVYTTAGVIDAVMTTPVPSSLYGRAVAAADHFFYVGAPGGPASGYVHCYANDGTLLQTITNPTPHTAGGSELFGNAMAPGNDGRLIVGAPDALAGGQRVGEVYLYDSNRVLSVTFTNPAPTLGNDFGRTVAWLGDDYIAIGDKLGDIGGTDSGVVYLYSPDGSLITTITNITPGIDDQFSGGMVSLSSTQLLVSAPADNRTIDNAGEAYLIELQITDIETFFLDADADGYGESTVFSNACSAPVGYVSIDGDCDDTDANVYPGAAEICDGIDNNCDGIVPNTERDVDGIVSLFVLGTATTRTPRPSRVPAQPARANLDRTTCAFLIWDRMETGCSAPTRTAPLSMRPPAGIWWFGRVWMTRKSWATVSWKFLDSSLTSMVARWGQTTFALRIMVPMG